MLFTFQSKALVATRRSSVMRCHVLGSVCFRCAIVVVLMAFSADCGLVFMTRAE